MKTKMLTLPKDVQLIPINNVRRMKAKFQVGEDGKKRVGIFPGMERSARARMALSQMQANSFSKDVILVLPFLAVDIINEPERRIASTYCRRQIPHKVNLEK